MELFEFLDNVQCASTLVEHDRSHIAELCRTQVLWRFWAWWTHVKTFKTFRHRFVNFVKAKIVFKARGTPITGKPAQAVSALGTRHSTVSGLCVPPQHSRQSDTGGVAVRDVKGRTQDVANGMWSSHLGTTLTCLNCLRDRDDWGRMCCANVLCKCAVQMCCAWQ